MLADTHCHLHAKEFTGKIETALSRALDSGLEEIWLMSVDLDSSMRNLEIVSEWQDTYPQVALKLFVGLDPELLTPGSDLYQPQIYESGRYKQIFEQMLSEADSAQVEVSGIGEIGIDHYWSNNKSVWKRQEEIFVYQMEYAAKEGLPVSIHSRAAEEKVIEICQNYTQIPTIVLHSFTGTIEQFQKALALENVKIGLNGIITYKSMQETLIFVQTEMHRAGGLESSRFLLETDSPYLIPGGANRKELKKVYGAEMNEPAQVSQVLNKLRK